MIVGNGLMANAFRRINNRDDAVIIASGVSNSTEVLESEFLRELHLIQKCISENQGKVIVYFSSSALVEEDILSVPYYRHKMEMEKIIKKYGQYVILRLPQIIGKTSNPNTILNFFKQNILEGSMLNIQKDAYRYFVDVDDVVLFVNYLLDLKARNIFMDFANPYRYSAESILLAIADSIAKHPLYKLVSGGVAYELDFCMMNSIISDGEIDYGFGEKYFYEKLKKMLSN